MPKISTRTKLHKKPIYLPVWKIRPTDWGGYSIVRGRYSTIVVIQAEDNYYYILDGNHRYFNKILIDNPRLLPVWVLEENDRSLLSGDPLPTNLQDWKNGFIGLKQLSEMAQRSYKSIEAQVKNFLDANKSPTSPEAEISTQAPSMQISKSLKKFASGIAESIIKILKNTSTLEQEAENCKISQEEFLEYYRVFIEGGIESIARYIKSKKV